MERAISTGDTSAFVSALLKALEGAGAGAVVDLSGEDAGAVAGSSLARAKELLNASLRVVTQRITQQAKDEVTGGLTAEGGDSTVFLKLVDLPFLEPRGRFTASLSATGMLLEGKTANCFIPWENVSHAAAFPSNTSTKKEGEDLLALRLSPAVKCSGKDLGGVLFSLNKCLGTPIKATLPGAPPPAAAAAAGGASCVSEQASAAPTGVEGVAAAIVPRLVQALWKKTVVVPRKDLFQSVSVGPGGATKPYLRCHKGVQEGAIYPLSNGVVFVKPLLFLPAEEIASLSAGRGGGSGQTRYVDLKIETADEKEYEFVNIEREELPALQNYVKGYLEARAKAEAERKLKLKQESGMVGDGGEEDDSDDEDDDDYDEDESEDDDDDSDDSDDSGGSDGDDDDDSGSDAGSPQPKKVVKKSPAAKKKSKSPAEKAAKIKKEPTSKKAEIGDVAENKVKADDMNIQEEEHEQELKENHRPSARAEDAAASSVPPTDAAIDAFAIDGDAPLSKRLKVEDC